MAQRLIKWGLKLFVGAGGIAAVELSRRGFGFWQIVGILSIPFTLLMLAYIIVSPGPRTKPWVDRLKKHLR